MRDSTMKLCSLWVTLFVVAELTSAAYAQNETAQSLPNIIFILADDLGYGDLGCYGQRLIQTPNLDRMALEGIRFRNFYAGSTVCAPSRAVLMTGQHLGHVHVRGNAGGDMLRQSLRDQDVTVAEILKDKGYRTALCGKWGLGESTTSSSDNPGLPNKQGFDYFFGYQSQTHAHNYFPEFLWENGQQVILRNEVVAAGKTNPERHFTSGYATKRVDYSHDLILDRALSFIRKNNKQPFFLYLALTIPHANNEGTRGTGNGQEIADYGIYKDQTGWTDPDKGQAAMISYMDQGIGRILTQLNQLDIDENTIVMFSSDNGHHNEGGHNPDLFNPNGPLRGKKRDLYEGGIRVPMIVRWPGRIKPDQITNHIAYFGDLMATCCDLIDTDLPQDLDSISFLPTLLGIGKQKQHDYLYWEFYEQGSKQALRVNQWKAVRIPMFTGDIELYDLEHDLGESNDVAKSNPEVVKKIDQLFHQAHRPHKSWLVRGNSPKTRPKPGDGKYRF